MEVMCTSHGSRICRSQRRQRDVEELAGTWQGAFSARHPAVRCKMAVVDRETVALQAMSDAVEADKASASPVSLIGVSAAHFFSVPSSQPHARQLREFFLSIEAVHEIQVDKEVFRRPGQAPLEELKAQLAKEARKARGSRSRVMIMGWMRVAR